MTEPIIIELRPTTFLTVGTVGPPGDRTFFLQGSQGAEVVSLILEKEQASALALALGQLLDRLSEETESVDEAPVSTNLLLPLDPLFRIGQIGLGYDRDSDQIVIHAQELLPDPEESKPGYVRFWVNRPQVRAFCESALGVVSAGRPICSLCGQPIDPEGHFCPSGNGHERPWPTD